MGCDGGTIAGRRDLVRPRAPRTAVLPARQAARAAANSCALSHQPLSAPVVCCAMGLLYNKEAVLEYLLGSQRFPHFSHINSLKDVQVVTLQWSKAEGSAASSVEVEECKEGAQDEGPTLYTCPITSLPSNGLNKFAAMQPCGCVVSERALRMAAQGDTCIVCSKPLATDAGASHAPPAASAAPAAAASPSAALASPSSPFHHPSFRTLFPGPEEVLWLRAQIAERGRALAAEKAAKKAAKKAAAATAGGGSQAPVAAAAAASEGASSVSAPAPSAVSSAAALAGSPAPAAASSSSGSAVSKRKAEGEVEVHVTKKPHPIAHGAHASLVSSRTGNVLSDQVRAITAQAAALVAERRKDAAFNAMFLSQKQIDETRFDPISTKPSSCMSML